jgi:hypothetical protein
MPFRIKPDLGQVSENTLKPSPSLSSKEHWDVFHDRVSGSYFANNTGEF